MSNKHKLTSNHINIKLIAIITVFVLMSSTVTISSAFGENSSKEKINTKAPDKKTVTDKKDAAAGMAMASDKVSVEMTKGSSSNTSCADKCYTPNNAQVKVGGTVTWKNADTAAHTVSSGKATTSDGVFDSGMVMAGKTFSYKFAKAGTFDYFCMVHPWMIGKVTVADQKMDDKMNLKQTPSKYLKAQTSKPIDVNTTAQQAKTAVDPLEAKKLACKQKETEREQYECEKALRSAETSNDFKQKSKKYVVGPITFYYPGAKVEKSGSTDILNLKFLVENTGSKDNVALYCTGPAACNYDISDGKTTYKYAANDFTSGQIVLRPGMSKELNIMFGPAIGYGSYVPFKYDPAKQYIFNVKEPWGSSGIPLELK